MGKHFVKVCADQLAEAFVVHVKRVLDASCEVLISDKLVEKGGSNTALILGNQSKKQVGVEVRRLVKPLL